MIIKIKDEISIGPQGLVCICAHPIYIWICWFGRFAFVKPSRQVISTLPLERRWISPKKSWIFQIQSSAFAVRWFIHICQSLLFSSLLINRNSFVQPIFTQPFLQCDEWWRKEIFGDGWWWIKGWSIAGFLPKRNCIYQLQSSAFADRWYPHLLEFQPLLLTYLSPYLTAEFGVAFVNKQLKKK